MHRPHLTRRTALGAAAALGTLGFVGRARAAVKPYEPPGSLVDAAKKEGRMVLYTASFTEVEQETIAVFNKRFPFVRIDLVRAPGGQLITRVKTELAAGKLTADVVDHSDRGLMKPIEDAFIDYSPPNAGEYLPEALFSPKFWPRITPGWCIAYHTELVKNPPKTWMDLTKPEYGNSLIGTVIAQSGGTTYTRALFEKAKLGGETYWTKQAALKPRLFPSGAPTSDSLVRGEISLAPLLYNIVLPKKRDGAPVQIVFASEGVPIVPYATGIPKTAANPNAAKLYMDWNLSEEGQVHSIQQGNLTSLKVPPAVPEGYDPKVQKVWVPDLQTMLRDYDETIATWNRIYGYRQ